MKTLRHLLIKEFRQIFRNRMMLLIIFVAPVLQLLILPLAADFEIKNINISIVDHDHSSVSRQLTSKIEFSKYFKLASVSDSYQYALHQIEKDKADLILEIPKGFEANLYRENKQSLFLAVNAINGVKAGVGGAYLSRIIGDFNRELQTKSGFNSRMNGIPTIEISNSNWFNPNLDYQTFMVPGILVLLVTMIGAYMCTLNIVKEKEMGTIEQINVTPIKKYQFILGKLIPFWIIGMIIFSIGLFVVARLIYGIVPVGSLLLLYGFLGLYLIAVIGIGLFISTLANNQQQAMSLAFFFMMIFILMGGLFTTIDSMPKWAQWVSRFNPVTYFIDVNRMVIMKGSGFHDIKYHFLFMGCFAIFINSVAIFNYRKRA
ncbi:MAG: transporter permease [Bacteroidetes bacterium]|nr:transporter permease [Bacteroidota bacterium]